MRILKWVWWFIVSLVFLPVAYFLMFSARAFEWLEEQFTNAFDLFCDFKHAIAPMPEKDRSKGDTHAEDDL
jgi:hypothetical protein